MKQERQFLEVAWESIENAGYTREYLQRQLNGQVGVFVGVMYSEYQLFAAEEIANKTARDPERLQTILNRFNVPIR